MSGEDRRESKGLSGAFSRNSASASVPRGLSRSRISPRHFSRKPRIAMRVPMYAPPTVQKKRPDRLIIGLGPVVSDRAKRYPVPPKPNTQAPNRPLTSSAIFAIACPSSASNGLFRLVCAFCATHAPSRATQLCLVDSRMSRATSERNHLVFCVIDAGIQVSEDFFADLILVLLPHAVSDATLTKSRQSVA